MKRIIRKKNYKTKTYKWVRNKRCLKVFGITFLEYRKEWLKRNPQRIEIKTRYGLIGTAIDNSVFYGGYYGNILA